MGLCMCDECSPRQSSIGPRWRRIGDGGKNATDADGADTDGINDKELGKDTEQDEMMEARDEDTKQLEVQVEIQPERYCKNTFKISYRGYIRLRFFFYLIVYFLLSCFTTHFSLLARLGSAWCGIIRLVRLGHMI